MRLRLDLAYDGTGFAGWAHPAGPADRPGGAGGRPGHRPADRRAAARDGGRSHGLGRARARPGGARRHPRGPASRRRSGRSSRPVDEVLLTRLGGVLPSDLVVHTLTRARRGLRRPVLRAAPPLHVPDLRRRRRGATRSRARTSCGTAAALDVDAMARRGTAPGRAATTSRRTASRGRARRRSARSRRSRGPGPSTVPTPAWWSRTVQADAFCHSMVRVARRREPGRGGGAPRIGLAGGAARRAASRARACTSSPRTGSRSRRWATRPTTSWPRGRCRRGHDGRPRTCSTRRAAAADRPTPRGRSTSRAGRASSARSASSTSSR